MRIVDLIRKKRDGHELSNEEISFLISSYTSGSMPDYQMSSLAMAIYFQGMSVEETTALTMAMVESGDKIDLSVLEGIKVDKHSTGGVGDKTTLILVPLLAAANVPVAKMSGRGLGHTGGTIDKLEAIEGFQVELPKEKFLDQIDKLKAAVISQTGNLTPADKKLYALRDVTATVESLPLLASSIMSKKIAAGADAILLDVKTGNGAFMKTLEGSIALAQRMVDIGKGVGRNTVAVITDMDQPLGKMIGNALEVKEAVEILKGEGPDDLLQVCLELGAYMLLLAKKVTTVEQGKETLETLIHNGQAYEKFKEIVQCQGGKVTMLDDTKCLPTAAQQIVVASTEKGYIQKIQAEEIGTAAMLLGAGRSKKDDSIDYAVGIELRKKVGDYVEQGEILAILHANEKGIVESAETLKKAYSISQEPVKSAPLIHAVLS